DREVKDRGATTGEVIKSLMAKKFYFRTSKFNTKSQKMNGVDIKELAQTRSKGYLVDADPLYYETTGANKHEVELPFVMLESDEPFDRFESQYYALTKTVVDLGLMDTKVFKYSPNFKFEGREDWRSQVFYGEYNNSLFEGPFAFNDNAWCSANFYDPDVNGVTPEDILPEYHAIPEDWQFYLMQNPWGTELQNTQRYKSEGPFGYRLGRQFPGATTGLYDYQEAYIEFWQWGNPSASAPSELSGLSVANTYHWLTNAQVNDVLPPPTPTPPSGLQVGGLQAAGANHGGDQFWVLTLGELIAQGPAQGAGGAGFPAVGGLDITSAGNFIPLIDFTEWVTVQDYHMFRSDVLGGLEELLDMSNSDELYPSVYEYNCESLPQPNEAGFFNGGFDPSYNFYYRYWKPIRAYLKVDFPTFDYAPYPHRPAGLHQFELANKVFEVDLPALNATN
ncbi:MAG: hypothetical protein KDC44_17750, partial [Phaeodactylibacter sp.]|nr:hypothetical protein [Phaeodactylibacter sp.]